MSCKAVREDWRRVLKLTSVEEAVEKLLKAIRLEPRVEEVEVVNSLGRVLAEDVVASQDIPPYNCACFEGYAVRSRDTKGATKSNPVKLRVLGKVLPDTKELPVVREGEAVLLVTGAPMPPGADAIVKVEEVKLEGDHVIVFREVRELENVALRGEDVKAGELILRTGHMIRPVDVGLLMGLGYSKIKVYAKAKFAILSVGKELYLKSLEKRWPPPNNYAYVIKGLIEELGGSADVLGILPDDVEIVKENILKVIDEYDVVVTMGSCSIGVNDAVPDAVSELGASTIVHGLALNPGKPAGFAVFKGKPIIMLPGHIVSAVAAFYVLCLPLLAHMTKRPIDKVLPHVYAKLTTDEETLGAHRFLRVMVEEVNGELMARPMHGGANVISTLLKSNYFTVLPPNTVVKKGDKLKFTALSPSSMIPC
ncbi:MAG: molybdopterin molybdotransferase MoeA [Candidatus Verstraetearchaeota archaeon]|jgi:molybdopterin molybdotransferase|nr:molybdopterin molybdotransferase MoeA [Candidatus Verstraetearchaeota archaeon]